MPMPGKGMLLTSMDIDAADEADFNRWYDREHLAERVAIEGFVEARRYVAQSASPKYLSLYSTETFEALDSPAYRTALASQTDWSKANIARFRNMIRSVARITVSRGQGRGAALGMVRIRPSAGQAATLRARLHDLLDPQTLDGVISIDIRGRITFMNPTAEAMTGWTLAEANGRRLEQVFSIIEETTGRIATSPVERCLKHGLVTYLDEDVVLIGRHAERRDVQSSASPLRTADGTIMGAVLVFQDVSASRALQKQPGRNLHQPGGQPHRFGRIERGRQPGQFLRFGPALAVEIFGRLLDQAHAFLVERLEGLRENPALRQFDGFRTALRRLVHCYAPALATGRLGLLPIPPAP